MRVTDWRGNEYGVGDRVVYGRMSGRSVEMQEGVVLDIWETYQDRENYKWRRLAEGETAPSKQRYSRETGKLEPTGEPEDTLTRVKLQPTGKGSRNFGRGDHAYSWPDGYGGKMIITPKTPKPVTLVIIENVTKL